MKKRVKIYKSPDNKGAYINKTKKFLSKFQMGGGITERAIRDTYARNVFAQLRANIKPEEVYANLLTSGMEKKMAGALMSEVISKMIEAGLFDPQYFEKMAKKVSDQSQDQTAPQPASIPEEMTDLTQSEQPYQEDGYSEGDQEEMMAQDETSELSMQQGGGVGSIKFDPNLSFEPSSDENEMLQQKLRQSMLSNRGAYQSGASANIGPATSGPSISPPPLSPPISEQPTASIPTPTESTPTESQRAPRMKRQRARNSAVNNFFANAFGNKGRGKRRYSNRTYFNNRLQEGGQAEEPQPEMSFDQYMDGMQSPIMDIRFPTLSEYISPDNISWDDLTMMSYGGMTKGKFVKSLLKKQEGGDSETIGTGNRQDTLTNEISKRKSDFTKSLKNLSTKALGEEIYNNANKLGDPKVMEMADGLVQEENSEMPKAQRGKIIRNALKVYKDLQPVKSFNKIPKDELKRLQQIRGLIRDKNFMETANDNILKKKLNSPKTSHVLDEDLQVLYPGMMSREGIFRAIAQGRGPLRSQAAFLDEMYNPLSLKNVKSLDDSNHFETLDGDVDDMMSQLELYNLTPEQAVNRFEMLMKNPTRMPSQGKSGFEALGIPSANIVPSLFSYNYKSPAALAYASKQQMRNIDNLPIGSIGTGSDDLTIDSKLMQDGHFARMLQNPERYGIFESPIFTGYNRLSGKDFLTEGYFGKKMYDDIYDLKFQGLSPAEQAKAQAKIAGDYSKLRRDYYMTNLENMSNLTGRDMNFDYPVLEYKPGSMSADQVPKDLPFITRDGMLNSNFGLGLKSPETNYDWVVPHFSLGKIKQEGGEMEDTPMAQKGGAAYKVAKAFMNAGQAEKNAVDPYEGYPIRKATINYNRQTVPYGTFSGRRGALRDMLFPANRMFGRMPYIKTKTDYTGPMNELTPLRREVLKTNRRGMPKKYIDYYTTGSDDSSELENQIDSRNQATQKLINFDIPERSFKDKYGDLKGSVRRKIRRGERQSDRADRRAKRNPEGNVPFLLGSPFKDKSKSRESSNIGSRRRLADQLFPNRDLDMKTRLKIGVQKYKDGLESLYDRIGYPGLADAVQMQSGGFTSNMGVNAPQPNMEVNLDAEITNLDPNQGMMGSMGAFMNNNTPDMPDPQPNNITVDPNQAVDPIQNDFYNYQYNDKNKKKGKQVMFENKLKRRTKVTDGEALANVSIAGIRGIAGLKSRSNRKNDYADYNDEMTRPENLYANTVKTYKGDKVDIGGKQLGLQNFDQMGQEDSTGMNTAKYGRFMQEGGYMDQFEENGEYELPEELIEYLLANGVELDFI